MESKLARYVAKTRMDRGWSQRELGRRAGISHAAVSKLESDEAQPTAETLVKIADAFGDIPGRLFQLAGHLPDTTPTTLDDQMLDAFRRLTVPQQQAAKRLLSDLAGTNAAAPIAATFPPDQTVTWGEVDARLQPYMLEIAEIFLTLMGTPVFDQLTDLVLAFRDRQRREQEQIHHQEPSPEPNRSTS